MSKLIDLLSSAWAIDPRMLNTMADIYNKKMSQESVDLSAYEARHESQRQERLGREKPYQVIDGVAIVDMHGVMAKRMNMFHDFSGGCSHQLVGSALQAAANDKDVKGVLLDVDSPGGTVDGTAELSDIVFGIRNSGKKIITYADGLIASAGVWVGSAASEIVLSSPTTIAGSIGVVTMHVDYSENDKMKGIARREIYAGKYKRLVSNTKPLDREGEAYMQADVDYLYSVFLGAVGKHKGISAEDVHGQMGDGKLFTGQQAIDAGLATRIATRDEIIEELATGNKTVVAFNQRARGAQIKRETAKMDKTQLESEHPELAKSIYDDGKKAGFDEGKNEASENAKVAGVAEGETIGLAKGVKSERQRIKSIEACAIPGHEKLVQELKFDSDVTADQAAGKILAAERKSLSDAGVNLEDDAPNPQGHGSRVDDEDSLSKASSNGGDAKKKAAMARQLVDDAEAKGKHLSITDAMQQINSEA